MAVLALEIGADLDLTDKTVIALQQRLQREIYQRRQLSTALKGVLFKRKATS
jgi:hypothetical protein